MCGFQGIGGAGSFRLDLIMKHDSHVVFSYWGGGGQSPPKWFLRIYMASRNYLPYSDHVRSADVYVCARSVSQLMTNISTSVGPRCYGDCFVVCGLLAA